MGAIGHVLGYGFRVRVQLTLSILIVLFGFSIENICVFSKNLIFFNIMNIVNITPDFSLYTAG